ncbi:glutathione S-transferase [Octadecabacter sp. 1_MG-2023]|uniref:glutathione S-transferase n=1 Tax=unclassified Octadecabacter TaxID=196158 RepID=UPI001C0A0AD7|nr:MULTISPECIES: glutathione S-transferase [unclassified Octadecabacter]MBU2992206.1 glutathione S-transferase [Octadecabacter sp. B2R22]MDO6735038.1 glutathione S-transferase [Octadecabacter sp. 1_MG-2023]
MKLIMSPPSPFARKARVLLRETGLIDRVEEQQVSSTPLNSAPEILAANPLGKIPALIREDGPAIYDSRVITRYLDDIADTNLYPKVSLYEVLTLEATAEAVMEACIGITYDARFRPDMNAPEWTEAQWGKAARAIAAINTRWMSHLKGPLNMAQIAVSCALAYVDLRHDSRNWRHGNESLAEWQADFEARDSMLATKP